MEHGTGISMFQWNKNIDETNYLFTTNPIDSKISLQNVTKDLAAWYFWIDPPIFNL